MISVCPSVAKTLNIGSSSERVQAGSFKLFMLIISIEFYSFIPVSAIVTRRGHTGVGKK